MTELNDHLKLLYARGAKLHCRGCGKPVVRDTPSSIFEDLQEKGEARLVVTFPVPIPKNFSEKEIEELLQRQGYTRLHSRSKSLLEVEQDRIRMPAERARVVEALEAALRVGQGKVNVYPESGGAWRYSSGLHCAHCDIHYSEPTPAMFSFNSPLGACESCRGFGRVIGVDFGLVVPDDLKTLGAGAVRPWQTASVRECQDDRVKYAKKRKGPLDKAWNELDEKQRHWVLEGEPEWVSWRKSWPGVWYGVRRFFKWLESKAYKMHIRVLLSKYRAYTECVACLGTRLKPEGLLWKIEGKSIHDLMLQPISQTRAFFENVKAPDQASELLLGEIRTRLRYLCDVGLGYLTLDRQSRTLSGGEVQRINLTTALGTSLVNTLFVLDEPSVGLHPRDLGRIVDVLAKLRDAGNTVLVGEHDAQVMLAADRIVDMGPGPGRAGGAVVFNGTPRDLLANGKSSTAKYLRGELVVGAGRAARTVSAGDARLLVRGAREHNLRGVD